MDAPLSLWSTAEILKELGNDLIIVGLLGVIAILFIPDRRHVLAKRLGVFLIFVIIAGYLIKHVA
jgi:hypothetical protein